MNKRDMTIEYALVLAREECSVPNCDYKNYCPRYWYRVFVIFFSDPPKGDDDPRWSELFKIGFPARREMSSG